MYEVRVYGSDGCEIIPQGGRTSLAGFGFALRMLTNELYDVRPEVHRVEIMWHGRVVNYSTRTVPMSAD
jgi:hypothetical protein